MEPTGTDTWYELQTKIGQHSTRAGVRVDALRLAVLVFARPANDLTNKHFLPNLIYFDRRSGDNVDFYWLGWEHDQPIMTMREPHFAFKVEKFVRCVSFVEERLSWHYSGEVDLILFEVARDVNGEPLLDFSNAIDMKLAQMMEEKLITSLNRFIENLIRFCAEYRGSNPVRDYATAQLATTGLRGLMESFLSYLPAEMRQFLKTATQILPRDLSKSDFEQVKVSRREQHYGIY